MLRFDNGLWVGNSTDEMRADVEAVLNVARDLRPTRGWPEVEYYHVGLVDGPGNLLSAYTAAVLTLNALAGKRVLVCCHEGRSRSLSVVIMYLAALGCHKWDEQIAILQEQVEQEIPVPHKAHRSAFGRINWRYLLTALGE